MEKGKVLGIGKKLFTACVSLADYEKLNKLTIEDGKLINQQADVVKSQSDIIASLKDLIKRKDEEMIALRDELVDTKANERNLIVNASNNENLVQENSTLIAKIKVLESNILGLNSATKGAADLEKALKEKLSAVELELSTVKTDLNIANADKKANKGATDRLQAEITLLKEKLSIEIARKEIKSSRGNSALKKQEVLKVVSLREANRGIISIAKEMDLTIDSVEKILSGESYSRWTAEVLAKPIEREDEQAVESAVAKEVVFPEEGKENPNIITLGVYNTESTVAIDNKIYLVGTKSNLIDMIDVAFPDGLIPVTSADQGLQEGETRDEFQERMSTLDESTILFYVSDIFVEQYEQTNDKIEFPILKIKGRISDLPEGLDLSKYEFSLRSLGFNNLIDGALSCSISKLTCWDLTLKSRLEEGRAKRNATATKEVKEDESLTSTKVDPKIKKKKKIKK